MVSQQAILFRLVKYTQQVKRDISRFGVNDLPYPIVYIWGSVTNSARFWIVYKHQFDEVCGYTRVDGKFGFRVP